MERKDYSIRPKDYEGGQSLDSFHSTHQVARDITFVKALLPGHYHVKESNRVGSIHCKSPIGIILPNTKDSEDEEMWEYVFKAIKQNFGERFQEVFHNTCYCHVDFTIYLIPDPRCKCGHLHSEHRLTNSHNYSAGRCTVGECRCAHFLIAQ